MTSSRFAVACLIALTCGVVTAAEPAAASVRLSLRDESSLLGFVAASPDPQVLRWQSPSFVAPFEFPLSRIHGVHFPNDRGKVNPRGAFGFELAGHNLLYGELQSIDATQVVVKLPFQLEPVRIERSIVHRIFRQTDDSRLIYLGPTGLEGWNQTEPKEGAVFREETGQIVTDFEGTIAADIELPPQAACEMEISWKGDPDFSFELGAPNSPDPWKESLRIEVIDQTVVAIRDTSTDADLAPLQPVGPGEGRLRLMVFIDQLKPQFLIFTPAGQLLADLRVTGTTAAPWSVRLVNRTGSVRLERLGISRWNGARPQEVVAAKSRLHRVDGAIDYGAVESFDAQGGVVVRGDQGEVRVPLAEVDSLFLSEPAPMDSQGVAVAGLDGTRLTGALLGIDNAQFQVQAAGITEPVVIPLDRVRSLLVMGAIPEGVTVGEGVSVGTLQLRDQFIRGWLVDGRKTTDVGCLVWRPEAAMNAVALRAGESGRVVYKEPPPPPSQAELQRRQQSQLKQQQQGVAPNGGQRMRQALADKFAQADAVARKPTLPLLHLRTGDKISCRKVTVEENGVVIESDSTDAKRISHEQIKVLELIPLNPDEVKLKKSKKERLLTLPRIQRPSPPTQLLRATSGDFLRGRVTAMNDEKIQLEVRLDNREVPRALVSHIFWLHPDELDPKASPPQTAAAEGCTRVQAYRNDEFRLTFDAEELSAGTLSGTSEVLGVCRVELAKIDQLMIGQGLGQAVAQLAYHRWKLKNAVDPKFASEGDANGLGRNPGTESGLVGKPAPDFSLELLDQNQPFKLSQQRGKIVVLEFWATWCGPCIRTMPMVEAAVSEFPADQVRLVAVNLSEQPRQIQAMLEAHMLDVTVALDVDGVVAERYEASAIPQTVIIDREGKIVRLFVGGSNDLGDQIKSAITQLLGGN
ncbi:MAG: TlpA family protein disulfide reductase [Planctomycetaceae bacterium]|jgi:thiol-disulfide isomerase/thioredoxin